MTPIPAQAAPAHFFLRYIDTNRNDLIRWLTIDILNYYYSGTAVSSAKKWKKMGRFTCAYDDAKGHKQVSSWLSYEIVFMELNNFGTFDWIKFNLYPLECIWLDHSLRVAKVIPSQTQPFFELDTTQIYGTLNPVSIRLNSDGFATTSMMNYIFRHVIKQREVLISASHQILDINWYLALRNLICDAVSLLDMTLNRLHYEAQNNPKAGWDVSPLLGSRNGVRLLDKIEWVYKCTGNTLPCLTDERLALIRLKDLRNQMMHFDPPYLIFDFNTLAVHLNDIMEVGRFIYQIRKTIGAEMSSPLISLLLLKRVEFIKGTQMVYEISM